MNESSGSLRCDYLVVGAGASGMAFCDSLLCNLPEADDAGNATRVPKIVLMDQHSACGGQWHDSYDFVRLHQPSTGYGVESTPLEPNSDKSHLATRLEILDYYERLRNAWASKYNVTFIGNGTLDLGSAKKLSTENGGGTTYSFQTNGHSRSQSIIVRRRLVDARYLQPDLPVSVPPKFDFNPDKIQCLPVNDLIQSHQKTQEKSCETTSETYFVVIGAGKTGMDAVYFLLTKPEKVPPSHIAWVIPNDPWITARENNGNCMEFLHEAATKHELKLQDTFLQWEREGKIYRLFDDDADNDDASSNTMPAKFKDATLSKEELGILRTIPASHRIRGKGRVAAIQDDGRLVVQDGTVVDLPFPTTTDHHQQIQYIHCSAGAFNYTRQVGQEERAPFEDDRITIQDVYGTPGFCFVGSLFGKLESMIISGRLTNAKCNEVCQAPGPSSAPSPDEAKLGVSTGAVGDRLTANHGYVQRLQNLRGWLDIPDIKSWLIGHRLFNLGHKNAAELENLVKETHTALQDHGLL